MKDLIGKSRPLFAGAAFTLLFVGASVPVAQAAEPPLEICGPSAPFARPPQTTGEMFERLRWAVQQDTLADPRAYTAANIACMFGEYTVRVERDALDVVVSIRDEGIDAIDRPGYTGMHAANLILSRTEKAVNRYRMGGGFRYVGYSIDQAVALFGQPVTVSETRFRGAPMHGAPEPLKPSSHPYGNSTLNFRVGLGTRVTSLSLTTNARGYVVRLDLIGGGEQ